MSSSRSQRTPEEGRPGLARPALALCLNVDAVEARLRTPTAPAHYPREGVAPVSLLHRQRAAAVPLQEVARRSLVRTVDSKEEQVIFVSSLCSANQGGGG